MSFTKIIQEVKAHPELWQISNCHYNNRAVRLRAWKQISAHLCKDVTILKKRWKNLKDAFRKELKKIISKEIPTSNWQHYNDLTFITEEILSGIAVKKALNKEDSEKLYSIDNTNDIGADSDKDTRPRKKIRRESEASTSNRDVTNIESTITDPRKLNLILYRLNRIKKLMQNNNTKPLDDNLRSDPDYMFLVSLLPIIKKLSDIQKLCLRGKINDWLLETLSQNNFVNEYDSKIDVQMIVDKTEH